MTKTQKEYCVINPQVQIYNRDLNNKKASWRKKLHALIGLAHIASEEAINILESYNRKPDKKMKVCAEIALGEAKLLARA